MTEKYLLSVITRNSPGVVSRITGLLRRKLFNIDSLTLGRIPGGDESRFTIVIEGDEAQAYKAAKLIDRLIEIRSVKITEGSKCLRREIVLAKFDIKDEAKFAKLRNAEEAIHCHTISEENGVACLELVDTSQRIDDFVATIQKDEIDIIDWVRSGVIAMER